MIVRGFRDLGVGLAGICARDRPRVAGRRARRRASRRSGRSRAGSCSSARCSSPPARSWACATRRAAQERRIAPRHAVHRAAELGRGVPPLRAPRRRGALPRPPRRRPPPAGVAVMPTTLHLARPRCRDARLRRLSRSTASSTRSGRRRLRETSRGRVSRARRSSPTCGRRPGRSGARARSRFRCELAAAQLAAHASSSGTGRHLAGAAVAVAALVLATGALPGRDDDGGYVSPAAGAVVAPLQLPIGQRSAMDDFAASSTAAPSQRSS